MATKKAPAKQSVEPEQPQEPAKIVIALAAEQWQDIQSLVQVGGQKAIDNIIEKVSKISEAIQKQLPQP